MPKWQAWEQNGIYTATEGSATAEKCKAGLW